MIIKIWYGVKEIIHISQKSSQSIKNLDVHGAITSNPKKIANTTNQFFRDILEKVDNETPPTSKK